MSLFIGTALAAALVISAALASVLIRAAPNGSSDHVIAAVEQHFAFVGTVTYVRPRLINFGNPHEGARQFSVDLTTSYGLEETHPVEVDASGGVRTLM